jgi:hypothetical protein
MVLPPPPPPPHLSHRLLLEASLSAGALAPLPSGTYQLQDLRQQQQEYQE